MSLIMRGRLYSSCVRSSMLHGSETWPVRKENVVALQRAEMRIVRWMCGVKLKDRLPSKELRERLGVDDIALILQQNRQAAFLHSSPNHHHLFAAYAHTNVFIGKQWHQLPELIPTNSNSGLHSCISISIHTQHVT